MHLARRLGAWLLTAQLRAGADREEAGASAQRREMLCHCAEIISNACALTGDSAQARGLAARYMTALWERESDEGWWRENMEYIAQPWFMCEYARAQGWLAESGTGGAGPQYYVLTPEVKAGGRIHMHIERTVGAPTQGAIYLETAPEELPERLMRKLHFAKLRAGLCARKIGEMHGGVMDRAVEAGVELLEAGYELCVQERALHDRIAEGRYEPMHRYWIYEADRLEVLYMSYPWEAKLHSYVRMAGGVWNGKRVEVLVSRADALEELALRYGFKFTREARRRLDAWRAAMAHATLYRTRGRKPSVETVRDEFASILKRPINVPEDLRDEV